MTITGIREATLKNEAQPGMVAHAFNPGTWEAEAGGFLSSRPTWSTEGVPGQPKATQKPCLEKKKVIIFDSCVSMHFYNVDSIYYT